MLDGNVDAAALYSELLLQRGEPLRAATVLERAARFFVMSPAQRVKHFDKSRELLRAAADAADAAYVAGDSDGDGSEARRQLERLGYAVEASAAIDGSGRVPDPSPALWVQNEKLAREMTRSRMDMGVPGAANEYADRHIRTGNPTEAAQTLTYGAASARLGRGERLSLLERAISIQVAQGDTESARRTFAALAQFGPEAAAPACRSLAEHLVEQDKIGDAIKVMTFGARSGDKSLYTDTAWLLNDARRFDEADAAFQNGLPTTRRTGPAPRQTRVAGLRARQAAEHGHNPSEDAHLQYAYFLMSRGRYPEAKRAIAHQQSLAWSEDWALQVAKHWQQADRAQEATRWCQQALTHDVEGAKLVLAELLIRQHNLEAAKEHLDYSQMSSAELARIADVLEDSGYTDEAETPLLQGVTFHHEGAVELYADFLKRQHRPVDAALRLDAGIDPAQPSTLTSAGIAWAEVHHPKRAKTLLERAAKLGDPVAGQALDEIVGHQRRVEEQITAAIEQAEQGDSDQWMSAYELIKPTGDQERCLWVLEQATEAGVVGAAEALDAESTLADSLTELAEESEQQAVGEPRLYLDAARARVGLGHNAKAEENFQAAVLAGVSGASLVYGNHLASEQRHYEAFKTWETGLTKEVLGSAQHTQLVRLCGEAAFHIGEAQKCNDYFESSLRTEGLLDVRLVRAKVQLGRTDEAVSTCRKAPEASRAEFAAEGIAESLDSGDPIQTRRLIDRSLEFDPDVSRTVHKALARTSEADIETMQRHAIECADTISAIGDEHGLNYSLPVAQLYAEGGAEERSIEKFKEGIADPTTSKNQIAAATEVLGTTYKTQQKSAIAAHVYEQGGTKAEDELLLAEAEALYRDEGRLNDEMRVVSIRLTGNPPESIEPSTQVGLSTGRISQHDPTNAWLDDSGNPFDEDALNLGFNATRPSGVDRFDDPDTGLSF
jgi:tetratricopeptide (TPR) repeat protein